MKKKITSLVLVFMLAVFISPNTVAMEREIPSGPNLMSLPLVVVGTILVMVGLRTRQALQIGSHDYFTWLEEIVWHSDMIPFGLWASRPTLHSTDVGFPLQVPFIVGDNIYLVSNTAHGESEGGIRQLGPDATPITVPFCSPRRQYQRPISSGSLIILTECYSGAGYIQVIERGENNAHQSIQSIPLEFEPSQPQSRGEYLYVTHHREVHDGRTGMVKVYRRNKENHYDHFEDVEFAFSRAVAMVIVDAHDILLFSQFGHIAVVRQDENGHHKIAQTLILTTLDLHYTPVVDGEFIYVSYIGKSPLRDFCVIRRGQDGVYTLVESLQVIRPTSAAFMGNCFVVASNRFGKVYVFHRNENGHHLEIQKVELRFMASPVFLVSLGNALYISDEYKKTIYLLYRQPDGTFHYVGDFQGPGEVDESRMLCQPVVHGDVLLLGSGNTLMTVSYPKKPGKK